MAHSCNPSQAATDQDHDASASAAVVAANLLGYARQIMKLDSVFTEYSAQYLVDNACPNKVDGEERQCSNLTVKDCLVFALKQGIPRADLWVHLGCQIKPSPSADKPALVSMKGEVMETMNVYEALAVLKQQPVGARMHVFSPEIDYLTDKLMDHCPRGISRYVGLRDVIICGVKEVDRDNVVKVKIYYKKKFRFITVSLDAFVPIPKVGALADSKPASKPVRLFTDFCVQVICRLNQRFDLLVNYLIRM